jgi:hypothetical protein
MPSGYLWVDTNKGIDSRPEIQAGAIAFIHPGQHIGETDLHPRRLLFRCFQRLLGRRQTHVITAEVGSDPMRYNLVRITRVSCKLRGGNG